MSVIVDGSNGLIFNDASTQTTAATGFGFKNRIINGDMRIDQRNAGAAVTTDNTYCLDRYLFRETTDGTASVQQSSTAPTGFVNSLLFTVTSVDSSLGTNQYAGIFQKIEGYNIADLNWGSANAKTVTLSFWVRSSVTGTYGGVLRNSAGDRTYPFSYTINSADTWEYETITVPGDTTGTWLITNGTGIDVAFTVAVASNLMGTAGAWASSGLGVTGQTNLKATNGATFYITGVQLEKGSTATAFDYRDYGREFVLCQRYYETTYPVGYSAGYNFGGGYPFGTSKPVAVNFIASDDTTTSQTIRYAVVKRTSPTVVVYSASDGASGFTFTYKGTGGTSLNVAASVTYTSENLWNINQQLGAVNQTNESYFHFTASAEL
jgi:hypothetical protein